MSVPDDSCSSNAPLVRVLLLCLLTVTPCALSEDLAGNQQEIARRFDRIEITALRIADQAEAEEPERAAQVRAAIRHAQSLGIEQHFERVVSLLEAGRLASVGDDQRELTEQLEALYQLVVADPHASRLEEERQEWEQLEKEVRRLIRAQRSLRARIEREPPEQIATPQAQLADRVGQLRRSQGRDASPGEPQGEPGSQAEGDSPPSPENPKKRVEAMLRRAEQSMRDAQQQLAEEKPVEASQKQLRAQHELESARREAQEQLRQLREEEKQRKLARLADRLRGMRTAEEGVLQGTLAADSAREGRPTRAVQIRAAKLTERQATIATEAARALRLIEEDGASLVFAEAMRQALADMRSVGTRLSDTRTDLLTQQIEQAVVDSLDQMLEAVEETLDASREKSAPGSPQSQQAGEPGLVGKLPELRLLRSSQARIQQQTGFWDQARAQGEASPEEAQTTLLRLADEQRRLAKAAHHTANSASP